MAKGTTNWDNVETWERVVASIVATGVKFGTTYDTLENRFREIKKEAAALKAEVDSGERTEVTPARTKSAPATPRKPNTPKKDPLETVTNGRVKKTPTKKKAIKEEPAACGSSPKFDDLVDGDSGSFDRTTSGRGFEGNMFAGRMDLEEDGFAI